MIQTASFEQNLIITNLKNNKNVIVDSIAGAGKTTTSLLIAKNLHNKKILLLTYNAALKVETREKITKDKLLTNITAHSFHSFAVKHYNPLAYHNISNALNTPPIQTFAYDIIIIDEAQDINKERFSFISTIIRDNQRSELNLVVIGDKNQCIYDFSDAPSDERYLTLSPQIFNNILSFGVKPKVDWVKCSLSTSYRVTSEMSNFINNVMLGYKRLFSNKNGSKPRYVICNVFGDVISEFLYLRSQGYNPDEIFILSYSVKRGGKQTPLVKLENELKMYNDVHIYVSSSDDETLNDEVIKNKLVITTFHSSKGRERKAVILMGFDLETHRYFNKDLTICDNPLYVASTRASEHISFIHHYQNNYLPFINIDAINEFSNIVYRKPFKPRQAPGGQTNPSNISVTEMVKYISEKNLDDLSNLLDIVELSIPKNNCQIPDTIQVLQSNGVFLTESVSDITGVAIPIYYEWLTKGYSNIISELKLSSDDPHLVSYLNQTNLQTTSSCNLVADPEALLRFATAYHNFTTGYLFKLKQITHHNWINETNFQKINHNYKNQTFSTDSLFEFTLPHMKFNIQNNPSSLAGGKLSGRSDCIDFKNNTMWEFKCTNDLNSSHKIQLALYMAMYAEAYKNGQITKQIEHFYLFNTLTGQKLEIIFNESILKEIVAKIAYMKYRDAQKPSDSEFLKECASLLTGQLPLVFADENKLPHSPPKQTPTIPQMTDTLTNIETTAQAATPLNTIKQQVKFPEKFILWSIDIEHTGYEIGDKQHDSRITQVGMTFNKVVVTKEQEHNSDSWLIETAHDPYSSYVYTDKNINPFVQQCTGIKPIHYHGSQLTNAPQFKEVANKIQNILHNITSAEGEDIPVIMMGHNIFSCDLPIIYWNLNICDGICAKQWFNSCNVVYVFDSLLLAKQISKAQHIKGNSVKELYNRYIQTENNSNNYHDALVDATATVDFIKHHVFQNELNSNDEKNVKKRSEYLCETNVSIKNMLMKRIEKEYPIKKPMTPYACFIKENITRVKNENPNMKHKDIMCEIAKLWKNIKENSFLEKYECMSKEDKCRYNNQINKRNELIHQRPELQIVFTF